MSTHGPQHDEFGTRRNDTHGGATYDEGFNSFAAAHSNAHGKLFDKFSERPGVDRYGEHWDEFPWKDIPSLHGQHYDEGYDSPSFDGGEHGQLHDVFRGARVRYMYGGRDVEGIVLDTQKEFAVVESREGDRHEVMLAQVLQYATAQGNPHAGKKPVEPLDNDSGDITAIEDGSQKPGPQGERPSGESRTANGGARVEGGSYDDTVVTHVKSLDETLDVTKSAKLTPVPGARTLKDEHGKPIVSVATCGHCGRSWNDAAVSSVTPTPSGRCPFEHKHVYKTLPEALEVVKTLVPFDEAEFDRDAYAFADVAKTSDGSPGVAHLSTAKLTEAHSKFSDHYTAARITGNHERAHFAAHVLASIHHELATRGVMAEKPDEGHQPVTRGLSMGHQPLRHKTATDDTDTAKASGLGKHFYTRTGIGKARYVTNHHDGVKTHSDGSAFYDIAIHNNKRDHEAFVSGLRKQGYSESSGLKTVGKSMDADETATQQQDVEGGPAANWCKHCQHYCRKVEAGKCPTCGGAVSVKKSWMDELDVLKTPGTPQTVPGLSAPRVAHNCPTCAGKLGRTYKIPDVKHSVTCQTCSRKFDHETGKWSGGKD